MLNKPLLLQMSQKTQHTRNEKIILGRIRCEKAPQVVSACINTNNAKNIGILNNTIQIQQHQIETGEAGVKSDRAKTTLGELLSNPSNPHQGREFYWNGAMEENLFFKRKACQKKRLSIGAATQPTDLKTGKKTICL